MRETTKTDETAATAVADAPPAAGSDRYDFRRPSRLAGPLHSSSERLFTRVAREIGEGLSTELRSPVTVTFTACSQALWADLGADAESLFFPIQGDNADWQGVFAIDAPMAAILVDRFLGGTGENPAPEGAMAGIGGHVLRTGLDRVVDRFERAIGLDSRTFHLGPRVTASGSGADLPGETMFLVGIMEIALEDAKGAVRIGMPLDTAKARLAQFAREQADPRPTPAAGDVQQAKQRALANVRIAARVRLGTASVLLERLRALRPGDVIVLDRRVGEPVEMVVGQTPVAFARPGRRGTTLAVEVTETIARVT